MNPNVKPMIRKLTQRQIDRLDDYEYSLFLAYGDSFKPTPTVSTGAGSYSSREAEASRLIKAARIEVIRKCKRLRSILNKRGITLPS